MIRSDVRFAARVEPGAEVVRSPVTDQPCVYWRLRIVERLTAGSQLVHEMASSQAFRLVWGAPGAEHTPVRILIEPDTARIEAPPALHRPGSPGAVAVARAFGFPGVLSVEEVAIHLGDEIEASGTLFDPRHDAGPFRTVEREPELLDATLTVASVTIGQALLPWAVGTAAAVLGGIGLATWAAWHVHAAGHANVHCSRIGPAQTYLERAQLPHPRLP
jgi:hypothetical protein